MINNNDSRYAYKWLKDDYLSLEKENVWWNNNTKFISSAILLLLFVGFLLFVPFLNEGLFWVFHELSIGFVILVSPIQETILKYEVTSQVLTVPLLLVCYEFRSAGFSWFCDKWNAYSDRATLSFSKSLASMHYIAYNITYAGSSSSISVHLNFYFIFIFSSFRFEWSFSWAFSHFFIKNFIYFLML